MALLLLAMPGNEEMARELAEDLGAEVGVLTVQPFPDRETYVRLRSDVHGRDVALVCTLDNPDPKLAPLLFAADLVREFGGNRVGLIAPYLAYMRQDCRFQDGEAITSRSFARLLSTAFEWLVTVDPHLHRHSSLNEIYNIPTAVAHAAPIMSDWIMRNVVDPLVVGPDSESEQWVRDVAARANAPHVTLTKYRLGDHSVRIEAPDLSGYRGKRPVLVDDIVASGGTLVEAAHRLMERGLAKPISLVVHAIFAEDALRRLQSVSAEIISSDTVVHPTNRLNVRESLAGAVRKLGCNSYPVSEPIGE
jgi:ribose-phosphate pyrophosphokinase